MAAVSKFSNEIKVASAVADLQANVGATGTIAADLATAQGDIITAQGDATQALADAATADGKAVAAQGDIDALMDFVAGPVQIGTFLTSPLYRKVIAVAAGPNNSTVDTAHGVAPVLVVSCKAILTNGTNFLCISEGGLAAAPGTADILVAIDGTNVSLTSGATGDYSLYAGHIVIEYTLA